MLKILTNIKIYSIRTALQIIIKLGGAPAHAALKCQKT